MVHNAPCSQGLQFIERNKIIRRKSLYTYFRTVCLHFLLQYALSVDRQIELKNPGIASVKIRKDCRILATGGWDGR